MRAGVSGVNIHVRAHAVNAAFTIGSGGLNARPLLYGLIAFARTLGPGAQLVPLHLTASRALRVKAWGVRVRGDALHVLLIDKGRQAVNVALRVPGAGAATVERLLAPTAGARSGVTFDGQYLSVGGTWRGRATTQTVRLGAYGYAVALPRYSAALVTLRLRAGAVLVRPSPPHGRHGSRVTRAPAVVERRRRRSARSAAGRRSSRRR
jgi:hypothetical protein